MPHCHSPSQNQLLGALPAPQYERLLPHLEPVDLPAGWAIHAAGDSESHLYFLTDGLVSRVVETRNGQAAEFALAGREGVIGVSSILGDNPPSRAVVVIPGFAYRLAARRMKEELGHSGSLALLLLRYTLALLAQAGQIATCNRHHSLERRLCRWMLSSLDRLPSSELAVSQDLIAEMLGVRREGISEAASKLQRQGLIHYSRGHIRVVDRDGLQAHACECYAAIKSEYDRLLPGRPPHPVPPHPLPAHRREAAVA